MLIGSEHYLSLEPGREPCKSLGSALASDSQQPFGECPVAMGGPRWSPHRSRCDNCADLQLTGVKSRTCNRPLKDLQPGSSANSMRSVTGK